jgi:hypothetical protein
MQEEAIQKSKEAIQQRKLHFDSSEVLSNQGHSDLTTSAMNMSSNVPSEATRQDKQQALENKRERLLRRKAVIGRTRKYLRPVGDCSQK